MQFAQFYTYSVATYDAQRIHQLLLTFFQQLLAYRLYRIACHQRYKQQLNHLQTR